MEDRYYFRVQTDTSAKFLRLHPHIGTFFSESSKQLQEPLARVMLILWKLRFPPLPSIYVLVHVHRLRGHKPLSQVVISERVRASAILVMITTKCIITHIPVDVNLNFLVSEFKSASANHHTSNREQNIKKLQGCSGSLPGALLFHPYLAATIMY